MHGLWNGSSLLGVEAYFAVYAFWMVPVFVLAIVLGVQSRRREQRIVAAKLPGMVQAGDGDPERGDLAGLDPQPQAGHRPGGPASADGQAGKTVKKFASPGSRAGVRARPDRPRLRRPAGVRAAERGGLRGHAAGQPRPCCSGWRVTARTGVSAPPRPSCGRSRRTPPAARPAGRRCPSCRGPALRRRHARPRRPRTAARRAPAAASGISAPRL